jgi:cell volume regulation protein A
VQAASVDAAELTPIAVFLAVSALLMGASVLLSRASERAGVPAVLLFLALGVVAGRQGVGRIAFDNYRLSFAAGTVALVLILFDGGLNTPLERIRAAIRPALVLATVGVFATAALVAVCARLFGLSWTQAFLLGAIVSSTDAAAVFSILRGSSLQLKKRVGILLELESGLNDPMAVALTIALTQCLVERSAMRLGSALDIPLALALGGVFGVAVGYGGRYILPRVQPPAGGLYPVLTLALAFLAYGLSAMLHGSGFLAVYAAAVMIGNGPMPYRGGILRVHDSAAWLGQISMFLLLGLLVLPSELLKVAPAGIGIGLFLALVARPVTALLCLLPFRYPMREVLYVGWVGLRGAVPIILAIYPVLLGADGAEFIFNVVFFVVVVNSVVPGATVRWVTRWFGLESQLLAPPPAVLEITSARMLSGGEVMSFSVEASSAACGAAISELPFPSDSAVILLIRGRELIAPRGSTVLAAGDHVYVLCRPEDQPLVYLIFGRPEAE